MIIRIVVYVIATWLVAAHFLRAGDLILTALCLATPLLFFVRERWSLLVLQGLAYVACLVWLLTAWQIIGMRRFLGEPWQLSAVILLTVAAYSVVAGALLRGRARQEC
jgi:hypothetical protein